MAYTPNELRLIVGGNMSNLSGVNIWSYDTTDAVTVVDTAGYISDATARGMKIGDLVLVRVFSSLATKTTISGFQQMWVISITSGAANLTDGSAIAATNTD
jgi:hypothetical protein